MLAATAGGAAKGLDGCYYVRMAMLPWGRANAVFATYFFIVCYITVSEMM
jgi:hypothetical protein